jgi:hypothetical protein
MGEAGMLASIFAAAVSVCVAATVTREGKARRILGAATGVMAALALAIVWSLTTSGDTRLLPLFFPLFLGFQFLAIALSR